MIEMSVKTKSGPKILFEVHEAYEFLRLRLNDRQLETKVPQNII